MIYFLNEYLMGLNSGVEYTEISRIHLFNNNHVDAKIVTRDYNQELHRNMDTLGLADADVVNMFDFFQNTEHIEKPKTLKTVDLNLPKDYEIDQGADFSRVYDGDRVVGDIYFASGTFGQVSHINYYDAYGHTAKTEFYDWRGFKSMDKYFGPTGNAVAEFMFTPEGKRVYESYYMNDANGNPVNSLLKLIDYKGEDYNFDNLDELFTFFLDELNRRSGSHQTFIADRPAQTNLPMLNMVTLAHKYVSLPIVHAVNPQEPVRSAFDPSYEPVFGARIGELDGIIVMTEAQKKDLAQKLNHTQTPIYVIPGTTVLNATRNEAHVAHRSRVADRLLYVGRLSSEKRIDRLIRSLAIVSNKIPNVTLDLYGYGSPQDVDGLKKLAQDLKVDKQVNFRGFVYDLSPVYNQAELFVSASGSDAMPLAMIEAMSHGLPAVAINSNYGPSEIIKDKENGRLIEEDDVDEFLFSRAIIDLLSDPDVLEKYSEKAYEIGDRYSEENAMKSWQSVLKNQE
ncbi:MULTISPECIES: accessory Sec system glycosyltransferase Asp1 [Pediococcus]|uniref:accessory Sec system glycosyltransferase Asp1 n=1 Tax=Pediococcus TaxID=1253 RepID=UPI000E99C8ED|nr:MULTISPECIES: accessory Sec system glycosyltransferase Asp1 [Pediococcus]MCT3029097.1 accessory Sec system glycosyltransferase Asp1 [Pediococcus parvulus]HBO47070.1 glycosyl transferase [Pediococcus sp.]